MDIQPKPEPPSPPWTSLLTALCSRGFAGACHAATAMQHTCLLARTVLAMEAGATFIFIPFPTNVAAAVNHESFSAGGGMQSVPPTVPPTRPAFQGPLTHG